jgi:hypothetical protein
MPKIKIWVYYGGTWNIFMIIWYILWLFGIFLPLRQVVPRKSGNPRKPGNPRKSGNPT